MQWPPTSPGLNFKKFHFVEAASRTSFVSIFIKLKIIASSFTNDIFRSLWAFSIALLASAIFIDDARWVPAVITEEYNLSIKTEDSLFDPDVTLIIFSIVFILSPGLILSGEYPTKKSLLTLRELYLSRIGIQNSSVQPG